MVKNKKEKLMEKAVHFFLTRGYERTTLRDLAKAVGIQAPGIYYHFKSKKDILYQINEDGWQKFKTMILDEAKKITSPEEKIKLYIRNMIKYQFEVGKEVLILDDPMVLKYVRSRKSEEREVLHFLRDNLREIAESKNMISAIDPTVAAFTLYAMVVRIYKWYDPNGRISLEEMIEQIIRLFFHGFYSGDLL